MPKDYDSMSPNARSYELGRDIREGQMAKMMTTSVANCTCKTCETQRCLDKEAHAKQLAELTRLACERPTLDLRLDEVQSPPWGERRGKLAGAEDYVDDHKDDPKPDLVNHPPHYKSGGLEVFDVLRAFGLLKSFTLGNVVKYILRAGRKGDALEDLKKARWYLDVEIAEREAVNKP